MFRMERTITILFLQQSMHLLWIFKLCYQIGLEESLNYPKTNKKCVCNGHFTHLKQLQYFHIIVMTFLTMTTTYAHIDFVDVHRLMVVVLEVQFWVYPPLPPWVSWLCFHPKRSKLLFLVQVLNFFLKKFWTYIIVGSCSMQTWKHVEKIQKFPPFQLQNIN